MPIHDLPIPKPKAARSPDTPKKEELHSRRQNKIHMLAGIRGDRELLKHKLSNEYNWMTAKPYTPEESENLLKENEYNNFLKRMLFKLHSVGGGELKNMNPYLNNDERNTSDIDSAGKYNAIWNSLTPAEKDQVIAASGRPDYKYPANLSKYLPRPAHKSQVEYPDRKLGNPVIGRSRKVLKPEMINTLSHKKNMVEKEIATPAEGPKTYHKNYKYWNNPGHLPTEKEADELRKNIDREIFEKRKKFKLERGHDRRYKDPLHPSNTFSFVWENMSPEEQDAYIAQETAGMSPAYIRKKYGVPSLIDQLPKKPAKKFSAGPKKTGEGSRTFEKEKLLKEIELGDEEFKKKISKGIIPKENAINAIRKHEYDNFLKRQQFKFHDKSYETALSNNPFVGPKPPFNEEEERAKIENEIIDFYEKNPAMQEMALGYKTKRMRPSELFKIENAPQEISYRLNRLRDEYDAPIKPLREAHYAKIHKDPRAREDKESAEVYARIWAQLTPAEKNQIIQEEAYKPKSSEYYMPSTAEVPLESKISKEEIISPKKNEPKLVETVNNITPQEPFTIHGKGGLFEAPIPAEEYAESRRRLKEERRYRREAKEQAELWNSLTPQQKNEAKLATQISEFNQLANQAPFMEVQSIMQNQGISPAMLGQIPPAMMQEFMQFQNQPPRQAGSRPRRSVYDRIMSSFDPNLFSPEFIQEEM